MGASPPRAISAALLALAAAACSGTTTGTGTAPGTPEPARARASAPRYEVRRQPYTAADVHFMAGMIAHHAQAIRMARMAPSHGAREDIRILCERIVVAQRDEIRTMQAWLRERDEHVPDVDSTFTRVTMHGGHDALMPGMLTADELARLDAARGPEFDRLFLAFMIRHHEGALTMVDELFTSYGAAQDDVVFKLASDIFADQSSEIERMQSMLDAMTSATGSSPQ